MTNAAGAEAKPIQLLTWTTLSPSSSQFSAMPAQTEPPLLDAAEQVASSQPRIYNMGESASDDASRQTDVAAPRRAAGAADCAGFSLWTSPHIWAAGSRLCHPVEPRHLAVPAQPDGWRLISRREEGRHLCRGRLVGECHAMRFQAWDRFL